MALNEETGEEYTLSDTSGDSETKGWFSSVGDGLGGVFNTFVGNYATALGSRTDSFGNVKPAGVTDPALQAQRNPLTGQLYRTNAPGPAPGGTGMSLNSPVVLLALAGVAAAFILVRR